MSRIGVVATPIEHARRVAQRLGLSDYVPLTSRKSSSGRGLCLDSLLVVGDVSDERLAELEPCLHASGGSIFRLVEL